MSEKISALRPIRLAIAGVGNCASSLLQGLHYYAKAHSSNGKFLSGLLHPRVGPYAPSDIKVVAAFDIDARK
ncbi:MAG: inositol-3-phosphate synthase, partial [Anaerolineae bacterium]|nr:inositol-3-phosphate synthase [Anaerolineae bacterium]